jgi:hypothetical protein
VARSWPKLLCVFRGTVCVCVRGRGCERECIVQGSRPTRSSYSFLAPPYGPPPPLFRVLSPPLPPFPSFFFFFCFVLIATADSCGLPGLEKERVTTLHSATLLLFLCCLVWSSSCSADFPLTVLKSFVTLLLRMCPIERNLASRRLFAACRTTTKKKKCCAVVRCCRDLLANRKENKQRSVLRRLPLGDNKGKEEAIWQVGPDSRIDRYRVTDRNRFADPKILRPSRRRFYKTTRTTAITSATSVNHPHPNRNLVAFNSSFSLPSTCFPI